MAMHRKRSNENIRIFPSFRKNSSNSWYFGLFFINLIWASECFERFSADGAKLVQKSSFLRKDPLRDRRKGAILETIKNDYFLSTILFILFSCAVISSKSKIPSDWWSIFFLSLSSVNDDWSPLHFLRKHVIPPPPLYSSNPQWLRIGPLHLSLLCQVRKAL